MEGSALFSGNLKRIILVRHFNSLNAVMTISQGLSPVGVGVV